MVVSSFAAAGCVPDWAEELTADEAQEFRNTLDFTGEHMDFAEDIMNRANSNLRFVDDEDVTNPTVADVRAQQEEALEMGYEMLDDGRIFVYRGTEFPKSSLGDAPAYEHNTRKPYIVFLENYLNDFYVAIHELTHALTREGHSKEVDVFETSNDIPVSLIVSDQDDAYRDFLVFNTLDDLQYGVLGIYGHAMGPLADPDHATYEGRDYGYDTFTLHYARISEQIDFIRNHPEEWGTKIIGQDFYGERHEELNWIVDHGGVEEVSKTDTWTDMGLTKEELGEIYTLPSTAYLREGAVEWLQFGLEKLREANPEFYAQYSMEFVKEVKPQPTEVRKRGSRTQRAVR